MEFHDSNTISTSEMVTLQNFKDIKKPTISETYKYFNKIIRGKTITNLTEYISSSPETLFDESLRLILIDTLHLQNEVLKILLSQNDLQIKRILQCDWFFQDLPAEFCTSQILPFVSLSVRCKIIRQLSKHLMSMDEAEKYFALIKDKYGSERANMFLPKCSQQFISSYIEETKATFSLNGGLRVMLNICKRYPEIGVKILSNIFNKKMDEYNDFSKYKTVIVHMSSSHPELMVPFLKEHSGKLPRCTFGRKLTKKLIPKLNGYFCPDVIKNEVFRDNSLFPLLSNEDKIKFIVSYIRHYDHELSKRNWCNTSWRTASLLKLLPQSKRLALMESTFKEVYNSNLNDHAEYWCTHLLETIPTSTRIPFVELMEKYMEGDVVEFKKNFENNCLYPQYPENFLYLHDSSVTFMKFKEFLRKTPESHRRGNILVHLVKSCKINNDLKTLEEVVDFVCTRHRNDDASVILSFIKEISEQFRQSELNLTIFEKLEDLAYFINLKDDGIEYTECEWKRNHILYRLENNLDIDDQIENYFVSAVINSNMYTHTYGLKTSQEHTKSFILALCRKSVKWIEDNPSTDSQHTAHRLLSMVLEMCKIYNKANKKNRISLKEIEGLEKILKENLKKEFGEVGGENWTIDIWERYYGDVINSYYKPNCLYYILKRNPNLVEKHLEGILQILYTTYFRVYNSFIIFLKKLTAFFGLLEKLKELILNEFKNGDTIKKRKTALELYSHFCTIEEFTKAVEDYIPKEEKVEKRSEVDFHKIQILIPSLIARISPSWKNLDLILKFFVGDFKKSVRPSFSSCLCKTRCDVALTFLKKRLEEVQQKVSDVKDVIRLILDLSDRKGRFEFCLYSWEKYKHYSIRTIVLGYVVQLFLDMPTVEWFRILEKCILNSDETTIKVLPKVHKIPKEFLNDYVSALWQFSENQKPTLRSNFRGNLIGQINEDNIDLLSTEFCESIIKKNLFNPSQEYSVENFATFYLKSKTEEARILKILDLIKDVKPSASLVSQFLNNLMQKSIQEPSNFADIFTVLLENWPEYLHDVMFEDRLLFTYHNMNQKLAKKFGNSKSDSVFVELGKELRKFFSGVENLNDFLMLYASPLKTFFSSLETSKALVTIKEFTGESLDRTTAILTILTLPEVALLWFERKSNLMLEDEIKGKKDLEEIIKVLQGHEDAAVQVYLKAKILVRF